MVIDHDCLFIHHVLSICSRMNIQNGTLGYNIHSLNQRCHASLIVCKIEKLIKNLLFFEMSAFMIIKVSKIRKRFRTMPTLVWLCSSVNSFMHLHIEFFTKPSSASSTSITECVLQKSSCLLFETLFYVFIIEIMIRRCCMANITFPE